MTGAGRLRVVVADDHPVVRAGLRAVVESQPDLEVVSEFDTAEALLRWVTDGGVADVVLLDLRFGPGRMTGAEATAGLVERAGPVEAVLPTPAHHLSRVREATADWPVRPRIVATPEEKWAAFGWATARVDGHDVEAIDNAIGEAKLRAEAAELGAALGAAGSVLQTGGLSPRDVVLALMVGNILSTPMRAIRHQLPSYAGFFRPALALRLILANQGLRAASMTVVTLVYYFCT